MIRQRHYYRQGDGNDHVRELQVNAFARANGPYNTAHTTFHTPDTLYTGFDATGVWRQEGTAVAPGLDEKLGNGLHPLNTLKWLPSGTMPWVQNAAGLSFTPGVASESKITGRWQLRGDFSIRIRCSVPAMLAGSGAGVGQDNAAWLGLTRATDPNSFWRVKRTNTGATDGLAVEIQGNPQSNFSANALTAFDFVAIRTAGQLTLGVYDYSADVTHAMFAGAAPGILVMDFGARSTVALAWTADFSAFKRESGWNNYFHRASWVREGEAGVISEDWVGDELDPALWTGTVTGNGAISLPHGEGMTLLNTAAGTAVVECTAGIIADFTVGVDISWDMDPNNAMLAGAEDEVFVLELRTDLVSYPRYALKVMHVEQGGSYDRKVEFELRRAANDIVSLDVYPDILVPAESLPSGPGAARSLRLIMERRGVTLRATVDNLTTGQRLIESAVLNTPPTFPQKIVLSQGTTNSGAILSVDVGKLEVNSPHDMLEGGMPSAYYLGSTWSDDETVPALEGATIGNGGPEADQDPIVCEAVVIDQVARKPSFRIVGASSGLVGGSYIAALPGGEIGTPWADPEDGVIWLPVRTLAGGSDGGFVGVDLGQDKIVMEQGGVANDFQGPVAWRHLTLGYVSSGQSVSPATGQPLMYARTPTGSGNASHFKVWVTDIGVTTYHEGAATSALFVHNDNPGLYGDTEILKAVLLPPRDGGDKCGLVVLCRRRGDAAVFVYRDLLTAHQAGGEAGNQPGIHADARYTGTAPDALNVDLEAGKLGGAANAGAYDVDATRPVTSELPLVVVARGPDGATGIVDNAVPANASTHQWLVGVTADLLNYNSLAVKLSREAATLSGPGWMLSAGGHSDNQNTLFGGIELVRLDSLKVWRRASTSEILLGANIDVKATKGGAILLEPPPGDNFGFGIRASYGLVAPANPFADHVPPLNTPKDGGVVEYDFLAVSGQPWDGPHIGGTKSTMVGFGLDGVRSVQVGGVDCFRVLHRVLSDNTEQLEFVNRALGWIEKTTTPVMPDAELEATATWPKDVTIEWNDGFSFTMANQFTYLSVLCIEYTLRRLQARLPEPFDVDPKIDAWPRHNQIALAWLICRYYSDGHTPIFRDTYRAEAEGAGLDYLAGTYGAGRPLGTMTDSQMRDYVLARGFGNRTTVKGIRDVLEPVLGFRPEITQAWRQFTVHIPVNQLDPLEAELQQNFWADILDANNLSGGYFDRNFWHGEDPRIIAARLILFDCRPAGVKATIRIEEPAP